MRVKGKYMIKNRVDILLSVYNPNPIFLKKQLMSLNCQTYKNIKLYVYDDCITNRCDLSIFEQCINNFEWEMLPYQDKNINYMKAFEKLVEYSEGEYVAFCDQDDIWLPTKIEKCVNYIKENNLILTVTDKMLIDKNDDIICQSVRKSSKKNYDNWITFDDITKYNIFVTYAVGMSIVLKGEYAKKFLPYSKYTGHDKWVLACASTEGYVGYLEEPLVQYRRHGANVSGVLVGIKNKDDYIKERIIPDLNLIHDFKTRYPNHKDIKEIECFAKARYSGNIYKLFKYRYLAPDIAKFDIVVALTPRFLFKVLVKMAQFVSTK